MAVKREVLNDLIEAINYCSWVIYWFIHGLLLLLEINIKNSMKKCLLFFNDLLSTTLYKHNKFYIVFGYRKSLIQGELFT